jgi:hypothetical protein
MAATLRERTDCSHIHIRFRWLFMELVRKHEVVVAEKALRNLANNEIVMTHEIIHQCH